jgi:hypothetical protein
LFDPSQHIITFMVPVLQIRKLILIQSVHVFFVYKMPIKIDEMDINRDEIEFTPEETFKSHYSIICED